MRKKIYTICVMTSILIMISGCTRIVDWGKDVFDQGITVENKLARAQRFIRSTTIYDEFKTVGMFDALLLSDQVRMIYADIYADRRGKGQEFKKNFLRRQFEENKHFISFYILSPYEFPLTDQQAKWTFYLHIDGNHYFAQEIKIVELDIEYKAIFGKKLSRFKQAYVARFDAKDIDDQPIITKNTNRIELVFKSIDKKTMLSWNLAALGVHSFSYAHELKSEDISDEDCDRG